MSELTLDEAIKHCLEVAEQEECFINYPHSDIVLGDLDIESRKHYVAEQRQIAKWLTELIELREENINLKNYNERLRDCVDSCVRNSELDYAELTEAKRLLKAAVGDLNEVIQTRYPSNKWQWRYADEALKLLGGEQNDKA